VSRSIGPGLSRRPPSAGQAPLAVLRGSLGLDCVCILVHYYKIPDRHG